MKIDKLIEKYENKLIKLHKSEKIKSKDKFKDYLVKNVIIAYDFIKFNIYKEIIEDLKNIKDD